MVPPMGFSLSFNSNTVMVGRDLLHTHPLSLILHQQLATRTLFVMKASSGKSFKLFINHLAPNLSKEYPVSIALF